MEIILTSTCGYEVNRLGEYTRSLDVLGGNAHVVRSLRFKLASLEFDRKFLLSRFHRDLLCNPLVERLRRIIRQVDVVALKCVAPRSPQRNLYRNFAIRMHRWLPLHNDVIVDKDIRQNL